jgi:hypothetical protein
MVRVRTRTRLRTPGSGLRTSHFRLALKPEAWGLKPFVLAFIELAIVITLAGVPLHAQTHYAKDKTSSPHSKVEKNSDGSPMVFANHGTTRRKILPVGADNMIEPGPDQGKRHYFYVRRQQSAVRVPKDWGKKDPI